MEERKRSKLLYKIEILSLKVLPMLLAVLYFIGTSLSLFGIEITWLSYISGVSLIPLLFMYLSSYVFNFCSYHRMFLHYISFNMIVNCIDWYIGIPISNRLYFAAFTAVTCIFLFVILYLYLKRKKK